jgi:uncharacterized protein DUF222
MLFTPPSFSGLLRLRLSLRVSCSTFDFEKRFSIIEHMFESSVSLPAAAKSLTDEILFLAAGVAARTAQLLRSIGEFDHLGLWRQWGCGSTVDWLAWQCGVTRMTAREYVRVARALRQLRQIRASFEAGELSYSKVRAVTRIANEENECTLLDAARSATASELERFIRSTRRGKAVTDPTYARRYRSVRTWTDEDGMIVTLARLAPDDGAIFWRALKVMEEDTGVSAETEELDLEGAPPSERRRADALVNIARAFLAGGTGSRKAASVLALVHVDSRDDTIRTGDRTPISAMAAERLLCDAAVTRVTHQPSGRIDVGRSTRIIPAALRRALEVRDVTCVFPGCSNNRYLEAHHYVPWSRGGTTCQENCGLFCGHHHHLVHEGGWVLILDQGMVVAARSPTGFVVHGMPNPPNFPQLERAVS